MATAFSILLASDAAKPAEWVAPTVAPTAWWSEQSAHQSERHGLKWCHHIFNPCLFFVAWDNSVIQRFRGVRMRTKKLHPHFAGAVFSENVDGSFQNIFSG